MLLLKQHATEGQLKVDNLKMVGFDLGPKLLYFFFFFQALPSISEASLS